LRPHKSNYWLFPKIEDDKEFVLRLEAVNDTYLLANSQGNNIVVTSSDEKTGIQAISHIQKTPMQQGRNARVDHEYKRNGTTCLIAARNITTGKISTYTQGETRTEEDYLEHVKNIVATEQHKEHIIICDQLNTHKSASLVKWIALKIGIKQESLGVKGKFGILKSQKSRMSFLENPDHRIRFLYTPKHCSWMNQIENWFAILQRKVIRFGEFYSVKKLEQSIEKFITYYNQVLAKPIIWKFTAKKYRQRL